MGSFFFLSNSCWNPEFHTFVIRAKVGFLEKLNLFMPREWGATAYLREGKLELETLVSLSVKDHISFFLICWRDFKIEDFIPQ